MDFVDGPSLSGRIGSGPLSPVEVRALFSRIAEGLAVAHAAGVVHRDLTPDNIILRDGDPARPVLIDFGIARSSSDGTLIGSGFAGKVNYVSPEQLGMFGGEVTARSDIYSLGLVIAASLTGKPIDMGGTHLELLEKRRHVPDLTDLPDEFRPLLEDMLAPAPSERQRSGADVARWLAQGTDAQRPWDLAPRTAVRHAPPSPVNKGGAPARPALSVRPARSRWVPALALMVVAAIAIASAIYAGRPIADREHDASGGEQVTSAGDRGRDPPGEVALLKPRGLPQKATPSEVPQARETPTPPAQQSTCACSTVGSGVLPTRTRKRLPTPIAWTALGPMIPGRGR